MEPIDPTYYSRLEALGLAVQYVRGRMGFSSADAIEIAEEFLAWLKIVEN